MDWRVLMSSERHAWTRERIARLGFLVGLGWDADRIADDPIMRTIPANVRRQIFNFRLSMRAARALTTHIPAEVGYGFDAAADKRGLTREQLIQLLLAQIADEPNLIDNILDDK